LTPKQTHTLKIFCFPKFLGGFWLGVRTVQELPGHKDVQTTITCTCILSEVEGHVLQRGGLAVRSPLEG